MRRKDREITEEEQIREILQGAKILHLALMDGDYPYVVPLHYGYRYENGHLIFYMHGAKEGHKLDLLRANPKACVELECHVEPVSGGEVPCRYGSTFASVIARGEVAAVTDEDEKIAGLRLLLSNQTGKDFTITKQMAASVEVLRFTADAFSAKGRLQ